MLPESVIDTYHRELTAVLDAQGVDAFRIGGGEELPYKQLVVCCGGPTAARLRGFPGLVQTIAGFDVSRFGEMPTQLSISSPNRRTDGEFHLRNSLIGHMLARVVVLFFSSKTDYTKWLADGVEASFLTLTQPANRDKHFVVACPHKLPLDDIRALTGAGSISASLDWEDALNQLGGHISPGFGGMVLVPSGEFGGIAIEAPFLISQAEVTQDLYASVMGANPSHFRGASRPVDYVSWFDMLRFANDLSGDDACYTNIGSGHDGSAEWMRSCTGFRLPTEHEWEYAARAFSPFEFSGSNRAVDVGWHRHNSGGQTHPVGQLKPNAFGTYDMSGNVWEWCWDLIRPGSAYRVLRGGSWSFDADYLRAAFRNLNTPAFQYYDYGGRLSRSLP